MATENEVLADLDKLADIAQRLIDRVTQSREHITENGLPEAYGMITDGTQISIDHLQSVQGHMVRELIEHTCQKLNIVREGDR